MLHERTGWACRFYDDVRQIAVAELTKTVSAGPPLRVEVLRSVHGLTPKDLQSDQEYEIRPGEVYRILSPLVLLKGKLSNLAHLGREADRPQDLKHARMLLPISRALLLEMHAKIGRPDMSERNFIGALNYALDAVTSKTGLAAIKTHALDLWSIFPASREAALPFEVTCDAVSDITFWHKHSLASATEAAPEESTAPYTASPRGRSQLSVALCRTSKSGSYALRGVV